MSLSRWFLALLISLLLVFTPAGGRALAAGTSAGPLVTLAGRLELVASFGIPHYEVNGYILVHSSSAELNALSGSEVVVQGIELSQPSLFMQKAIAVQHLTLKSPASEPGQGEDREVSIPEIPDPSLSLPPGSGAPVTIPSPPIPFYGTSFYLLYGRIIFADGKYFVVDETPSGQVRIWVTGSAIQLAALNGKQVGAIAGRESLSDGSIRYHIYQALVLSDDLADRIEAGTAVIYLAPAGEITVRLRGRVVNMDQAPVMGNGRTLVGLRAIAEAMGAQVAWDAATRTATVHLGDREVVTRVGSSQVIVRQRGQADTVIHNDVAPVIVSGRTMVPARVLSEGLGLSVSWTEETRTVDLR